MGTAYPFDSKTDEAKALMVFKPKLHHILAVVLVLSVLQFMLLAAHLGGFYSGDLPWLFWANVVILGTFTVIFLHLLDLSRRIYVISDRDVNEISGLIRREKRTIPLGKVFGYRLDRSGWDLVLGTANLTILASSGTSMLEISAVHYSDACNAENLLGRLLVLRGPANAMKSGGPN